MTCFPAKISWPSTLPTAPSGCKSLRFKPERLPLFQTTTTRTLRNNRRIRPSRTATCPLKKFRDCRRLGAAQRNGLHDLRYEKKPAHGMDKHVDLTRSALDREGCRQKVRRHAGFSALGTALCAIAPLNRPFKVCDSRSQVRAR